MLSFLRSSLLGARKAARARKDSTEGVAPQVSSEVSPSISPPAQAVETAAGAAKAFDPWPSTPVSASWPSQEIQDSAEQAERAIQWPSVEVPPTPEAQEITQTQLEEPEKPQPITLEVAPQVSSEVSPSFPPPAQVSKVEDEDGALVGLRQKPCERKLAVAGDPGLEMSR
ncbi:unnamed protein product [Durusdinium trenchii]|uniref:Uncharacterized protein n=1 Tax=Durusdinium trenchii TaxID=1381693 RepID=A0ABP0R674_9DINO